MNLEIYTDGSCWLGKGSWAFVMVATHKGKECLLKNSRAVNGTTNNRMEMTAVIEAVKQLQVLDIKVENLVIYSDSQYTVNMFNGKWKVKPSTKNPDLIKEWNDVKDTVRTNITLKWIRGHDGNKYNELADQLCNEARER